ncbi:hypothetical protein FRACA_1400001 [Frankia canadensis]|uniref:Uncharacterized protein n=1 Tax=Frankia canadensis TaxID=1836972 RepID=A0A2I2KLB8_9ACTN|nr:hypothetical protein FRACA_1400001 [Frankia canadensis]SOU53759.1 hypothetical protein FRACA_1400001 [Frankia canadensis]
MMQENIREAAHVNGEISRAGKSILVGLGAIIADPFGAIVLGAAGLAAKRRGVATSEKGDSAQETDPGNNAERGVPAGSGY